MTLFEELLKDCRIRLNLAYLFFYSNQLYCSSSPWKRILKGSSLLDTTAGVGIEEHRVELVKTHKNIKKSLYILCELSKDGIMFHKAVVTLTNLVYMIISKI